VTWALDAEELESDRELVLGWVEEEADFATLQMAGRVHRWLDHEQAAREYFQRSAADLEREVAAMGGGLPVSWAHVGGLRYLAGDRDGARAWLERARKGFDATRDRPKIVALSYELGDDDDVLRRSNLEDVPTLLATARSGRDPAPIEAAVAALAGRIRAKRLTVLAAQLDVSLSDYDWLDEAFRLEAELRGEPTPDHATMLQRAGLLGGAPPHVEPALPMGRWEIGETSLVVPARGRVKATLDAARRLVLEIEGEPPSYGVALYEDDARLAAVSPVPDYTGAAVDILRAHAPEAEAPWRALLAAARG
jgi:hypothetical protein